MPCILKRLPILSHSILTAVGQGGQALFPLWEGKKTRKVGECKAPTPATGLLTCAPDASTETAVPDCLHTRLLRQPCILPPAWNLTARDGITLHGWQRLPFRSWSWIFPFCVSNPLSTVHTVAIPALPGYLACLWHISTFKSPAKFVLNSHGTWGHGSSWRGASLRAWKNHSVWFKRRKRINLLIPCYRLRKEKKIFFKKNVKNSIIGSIEMRQIFKKRKEEVLNKTADDTINTKCSLWSDLE